MARRQNTVNFVDVTILSGGTVIIGGNFETIYPQQFAQNDILQMDKKTVYYTPKAVPLLGERAKSFLAHAAQILWIKPMPKRHRVPALCFPARAADPKERQVQEMNYQNCVRTMAEMFRKYAPQLLHQGG